MDTRRALIEALEQLAEAESADSFGAAFAFLRGYVITRSGATGERDEDLNAAFEKAQQAITSRNRASSPGPNSR
jgi:hypothetical protein